MSKVVICANEPECQALMQLLDAAVKHGGLPLVPAAAVWQRKVGDAVTVQSNDPPHEPLAE